MGEVNIVETEARKIENPVIVIGLPEAGLVGTISCMYIIKSLEMEEVGYIETPFTYPVLFLHKGKIAEPIRIFQKNSIFLVSSEIAIPPEGLFSLVKKLAEWIDRKKSKLVLMLGGIPTPNRMEIQKPRCFGVISEEKLKDILEKAGVERLGEGIMVGPYSMLLREAIKRNFPAVALLAQSYSNLPDPGSAASVIQALNKIIGTEIKVDELLQKAEEVRIRSRDLMRRTSDVMRRMGKARELETPSMYI